MPNEPNPTILVVNDDDPSRDVTVKILKQEGFAVREARTEAEARTAVREHPDLVLVDVNLPDGNGFELCRNVKSDPATRDIPVLLHLSGNAVSAEERAAGLESGADAYLTQPVDPGLLIATVKTLLRTSRAEREARRAARGWQRTFDAVSHGIALLDTEGRIISCNRALADLTGTDPQALVGKPHDAAIPEAEPPEGGWPFERARASGRREVADVNARGRVFRVTADPITDEQGRFAGAVRTVVDISDKKREEQERERLLGQLAQERARLDTVLQQLPAGVVFADAPSGRVLMANEHFTRMFRLPAKGTIDLAQLKGCRPDGRRYQPEEWPLARSLASGEVVANEEIEIIRPDGTKGWVLVSSAPVRDRAGYITAGVGTFNDITERRQLEDQFRQSQKMEAVGRLAGGVAHDFNNLLTIIGGYGQMLLDTMDPSDPIRKDMEAIMEAANRASSLTRQLLTVSRRQVVQPKVFELNRLISRMHRMLRRVIGEDIELVHSLKSDKGRIKADPGQIEQVLLNLAVNARDAMPKGGKLTIETSDVHLGQDTVTNGHVIKAGKYVLLAFSDTGTGMTPEVLSHVFEPFFTTKARGKGTGLGLSTVYGIIKQTGAEIVVNSEPGAGTTFRIYFPAVSKDADRGLDAVAAQAPARRGSETILLVEDESDVRRLAAEMLVRQGYSVIEADSGAEALRMFEQHHSQIQMLLTDVVMPKMSGPELAKKLKAKRPELRVMYMSGYTDDVVASHGGVEKTTLLQKPFTADSLGRAVRSVLDS